MNKFENKLKELYEKIANFKKDASSLTVKDIRDVKLIGENCNSLKAIPTVIITLGIYKIFYPAQDIRYHRTSFENGFSARTFDTNFITPAISRLDLPAMRESGWLTRSIEQNAPFDKNFPGRIRNLQVKNAFLDIVHQIQFNEIKIEDILVYLLQQMKIVADENKILIKPLTNPEKVNISNIVSMLDEHFSYNYKTSNGSKLPVIAFYSIYELLVKQLARFDYCKLQELGSHHASDQTSKSAGDIEIFKQGSVFEALEIKMDKVIDYMVVNNAKEKILINNPSRYYILSTMGILDDDYEKIMDLIDYLENVHGCQLIINGILPSLKYYLRLLEDPFQFLEQYSNNIAKDIEIKKIHKDMLNNLLDKYFGTELKEEIQ